MDTQPLRTFIAAFISLLMSAACGMTVTQSPAAPSESAQAPPVITTLPSATLEPTALPDTAVQFRHAELTFTGLFSRTANFHLEAVSNTPIQTATVIYYYFSGVPLTRTLSLDSAQTQLSLDISNDIDLWAYADGLSRAVVYRWSLTDVSGRTVTSPRYTELYRVRNTEHDWQVIILDHFHVYYYEGGEQIARNTIGRAAEEVFPIVTRDWGIVPPSQINIHVYSSRADYLNETEKKWSAGYAPPYEIVLSPVSSYATARLVVGHELTHNVQRVWTPFGLGPSWFAEGIAAYEESSLGTTRYADALANNIKRGGLLPLSKLMSTSSKDEHVIDMIYAEGYGVISYLIDTYGKPKLLDLLQVMGKNRSLDKALLEVYAKSQDEIEMGWRASLK